MEGDSNNLPNIARCCIQDSSSAGSDLSIVPNPSIGAFTAERYRVGIPALQSLPLHTTTSPPLAASIKISRFLPRIYEILERRDVDFEDDGIDLRHRTIPGDVPSDDDLTLLIDTNWNSDDDGQKWYLAAGDIRDLLTTSSVTSNIKVELLSWKLVTRRIIEAVEATHPMVEAWPRLNPLVHAIIAESPKLEQGWGSIDVLRIGFQSDECAPPMPVTVSITVDWSLDHWDWVRAEREIKNLLERNHLSDVEVEFLRGDVGPNATGLLLFD